MNKKQLFEKFIKDNLDNAYRFSYTYTKNQYDAEDIVNESVIKALKSINSLKNPEYIKSWFYKIISNTAINFINKKNKTISYEENLLENEISEDNYEQFTFNDIVNKLDIKYRAVIVMRFLEDMSIKEISKILDLNENSVKSRLYRGLKILKNDMEDLKWKNLIKQNKNT